jgi:hypothetical protein
MKLVQWRVYEHKDRRIVPAADVAQLCGYSGAISDFVRISWHLIPPSHLIDFGVLRERDGLLVPAGRGSSDPLELYYPLRMTKKLQLLFIRHPNLADIRSGAEHDCPSWQNGDDPNCRPCYHFHEDDPLCCIPVSAGEKAKSCPVLLYDSAGQQIKAEPREEFYWEQLFIPSPEALAEAEKNIAARNGITVEELRAAADRHLRSAQLCGNE